MGIKVALGRKTPGLINVDGNVLTR